MAKRMDKELEEQFQLIADDTIEDADNVECEPEERKEGLKLILNAISARLAEVEAEIESE